MAHGATAPSKEAKAAFLDTFRREVATTLKVLRAYPTEKTAFRPHETSVTARELAWLFALEQGLGMSAVKGELSFDASKAPGQPPAAPETMPEIIGALEQMANQLASLVESKPESDLAGTVRFPVGPGKVGDWSIMDFLWFLLHDQIHHRGQFSVYLRMTGSKVPSIYGPSKDEPWF